MDLLLSTIFSLLFVIHSSATSHYWVEQALQYQYDLVRDEPLNVVPLIESVHSFDSPNPLYTGPKEKERSRIFRYQKYSLTSQLDLGVRFLDFSLHWIPSQNESSPLYACMGSPSMYDYCYGQQQIPQQTTWCQVSGLEDYGPNTGCRLDYDRTWQAYILEVRQWLTDNPTEFVWIDVDWTITTETNTQQQLKQAQSDFMESINSLFKDMIFSPSDKSGSWPTLNSLQSSGKRVGIICPSSSCPSSTVLWSKIESTTYPESNHEIVYFQSSSCSQSLPGGGELVPPQGDFYYFSEGLPTEDANNTYNETSVRGVLSCDYLLRLSQITYDKMKWAVWSWAEGEPLTAVSTIKSKAPNDTCVFLDAADSRWHTATCASAHYPFACFSSSWLLSDPNQGHLSSNCPSGSTYSTPSTASQNAQLLKTLTAYSRVWLNARPSTVALPPSPLPKVFDIALQPNYTSMVTGGEGTVVPVTPRFCALAADADHFTCEWQTYEGTVAARIPGYIVFGLFLSIFCLAVFLLVGYFWKQEHERDEKFKKGELKDSDEDIADRGGRYRDQWMCQALFLIPVVFLIIGMGVIWASNIQFNSVSGGSRQELADRLALLQDTEECIKDIMSLLEGTTVTLSSMGQISDDMQVGLAELNKDINFFVTNIDSLTIARNVIVIFTSIMPLVLSIIGCLLLKAERLRAMLFIIGLLNVMILMTGSSFIVHADVNIVAKDVCNEFSYSGSIFQLWEKSTGKAAAQLSSLTEEGLTAVMTKACNSWDALCVQIPNQVCGNYECGPDTIDSLINATIIIDSDGSTKLLSDCVTICKESQLRAATESFIENRELSINVFQSFSSLSLLQSDVYSNSSSTRMKFIFCEGYRETIKGLDGGFSVLLIGQIFAIVFFFKFGW